jgi:hypothetical protein
MAVVHIKELLGQVRVKRLTLKQIIHPILVPMLRTVGPIHPLPHNPSRHAA